MVVVVRQLFESRQLEDIKNKKPKHQSVLCSNAELKTIFKMNKNNRKILGWSVWTLIAVA